MNRLVQWLRDRLGLVVGVGAVVLVAAVAIPNLGGDDEKQDGGADQADVVTSDPVPAGQTPADVRKFWTPERMRQAKPLPLPTVEIPAGEVIEEATGPAEPEGPAMVVPAVEPGAASVPEPREETLDEEGDAEVVELGEPVPAADAAEQAAELKAKRTGSEPAEPKKAPSPDDPTDPKSAPANDNFSSAQALSGLPASASGTNVEATSESGEPTHAGSGGGASIWYSWQAPSSGQVTIDVCGSDFDTVLGVYTGSAVNALTQVAADDDSCPTNLASTVTFTATSGTTYRIAVDGYDYSPADTGNVVLNITGPALNDDFANAQVLTGIPVTTAGTNVDTTKETGEPSHAGNPGGSSVWYRWQAPSTERVMIHACGSALDTLLGVYTGSSVNSLTTVASNDDEGSTCGYQSKVSFNATAGTTYRIAVDGYNAGFGAEEDTFQLQIRRPTIPYDRFEITNPSTAPNRTHGKVFFELGGDLYVCSATVVTSAPRSVVFTAGHCANDPGGLGWASYFEFVPGYRNGSAPYGEFAATELASLGSWVNQGNIHYDISAAILGTNASGKRVQDVVGARGIAFNQPRNQHYKSWGYPAADPFDGERLYVCESNYGMDDPAIITDPGPRDMGIGCDMTGGSSGGGWLVGDQYLQSVNSFGLIVSPPTYLDIMFGPYFGNDAQGLYNLVNTADTTPPNTTITKHPRKRVRTGKAKYPARFSFRSSEAGSFRCKLDKGAWMSCTSPRAYKIKATRRFKKHTFQVQAVDRALNADRSPAIFAFRLKRTG
jgi:V8-like Glu-specific endopeptidase